MAVEKTVVLRGWKLLETLVRDDKIAGEVGILPGMMLNFEGSGTSGELFKHHEALGNKVGLYAIERDEAGKDFDVAYAVGDTVKYVPHVQGVVLNLLQDLNITVTKGDAVGSAGNGAVKSAAGATEGDAIVGYADETITTTGAYTRLAVRLA